MVCRSSKKTVTDEEGERRERGEKNHTKVDEENGRNYKRWSVEC